MKLRSPAWIIVAAALIVQGSGGLSAIASAIVGIDNGIKAVIDIKAMFHPVVIKPIKPVIIPPMAKPKNPVNSMPVKAPRK